MERLLDKLIGVFKPMLIFRLSVFSGAYFIYAFVAYLLNYSEFDFFRNFILFICCLISFKRRLLNVIWSICCAAGIVVLFYKDSYLPAPGQIYDAFLLSHQSLIEYASDIFDSNLDFRLFVLLLSCLLISYFVSAAVRVATCVAIGFMVLGIFNIHSSVNALSEHHEIAQSVEDESPDLPPLPQGRSNEDIESYWQTFLELEGQRKVDFITALPANFTPFDVIILNICSLSVDDLKAASLSGHELFSRFDYSFDDFNSASSYSTPSSLRLLRMNCGQMTEAEIYSARRSDCEIMTSLESLGYQTHTFFDHDGAYGDYLKTLHDLAGLNDHLHTHKSWRDSYKAFDGSLLYSDKDLFDSYTEQVANGNVTPKATFMNLLSLHDGNRYPNENHGAPYEPRLSRMLEDINGFVTALSNSHRPTLLIMVPEHGAAIRGDKMQIAKLREIPTYSITNVPVLLKFFGAPNTKKQRQSISGRFSYLALAEIINRSISLNVFSQDKALGTLDDVMTDLPQTAAVSEATNALYVEFPDQGYYMLKGGEWSEYKK